MRVSYSTPRPCNISNAGWSASASDLEPIITATNGIRFTPLKGLGDIVPVLHSVELYSRQVSIDSGAGFVNRFSQRSNGEDTPAIGYHIISAAFGRARMKDQDIF